MKKLLPTLGITGLLFCGYSTVAMAGGILTSIDVTPINSTITAGQTKQYTATARFRDVSTQNITSAGSFSATSSMGTPRESPSASTLIDGRVLVSGGVSDGVLCGVCNTAELYDPATETFSYTGNMATERYMHTSTLLGDGNVLVTAGGVSGGGTTDTAELYNPATNSFSATNGPLSMHRIHHRAALLGSEVNSKVLIVGGATTGWVYTATAELYDPVSKTFAATGSMSIPRIAHTATTLPDGTVLIAGGRTRDAGGIETAATTAEIYNPVDGTFTPTNNSMITPAIHGTATLLQNGKVLLVGGSDTNFVNTNKAQLYDPASRTFAETGSMTTARAVHVASLLKNGKVLVAGGWAGSGVRVNAPELYDSTTGTFSATGLMSTGRNWHRGVTLNNGQVFVVGGFVTNPATGGGMETATAELYTPQADWTSGNSSVVAINATGLATSGTSPGTISITATSGSISGSTSLLNSGSDLVVTAVSANVTTINRGSSFSFKATTLNQGNAASGVTTNTGLYLSTDTVITTADTRLGSLSIASLGAGSSKATKATVTVPTTLAPGTYYLGAIADYTGVVTELNEGNNSFRGTTVQVR